jgi:hypothetical protein
MPSRPTEMAAASSVPSSFLLAAEMKFLAPGFSSSNAKCEQCNHTHSGNQHCECYRIVNAAFVAW